jgi:hypothetical protein
MLSIFGSSSHNGSLGSKLLTILLTLPLNANVRASPRLEHFIHPDYYLTSLNNRRGSELGENSQFVKRVSKSQFVPPATNGGQQLTVRFSL